MTDGETVLKQLNTLDAKPADDELPFESLDDYATDPAGFEEIAAMVSQKVEHIFTLTQKYNHASGKYLEICAHLERGIKYLASCCITKAVLEAKKDMQFPTIDELTTHRLFGMVSFNLRKLNRTVNEKMAASDDIPAPWYDMFLRYVNLAERLKSTETKIYLSLGFGGYAASDIMRRALMFSDKAFNRNYVKRYVQKPVFRANAPAFPVLKEVIREEAAKDAAEQSAAGENIPAEPQAEMAEPASSQNEADPTAEAAEAETMDSASKQPESSSEQEASDLLNDHSQNGFQVRIETMAPVWEAYRRFFLSQNSKSPPDP